MPIKSKQPQPNKPTSSVNVAVAVIHYQQQYLLGFRNSKQHQGNRYEFVGGKMDGAETAKQALMREVNEETGIDIHDNTLVKLGRLHHDYGDKQVCLQVYNIELTAAQYEQHRHCQYGLEGQALSWVSKSDLLAGKYPLPAANQTILAWLRLPSLITVTYPLAHFNNHTDATAAWLEYHRQRLTADAWIYIRAKATVSETIISETIAEQLMQLRPDLQIVVPNHSVLDEPLLHNSRLNHSDLQSGNTNTSTSAQIVAIHLTHTALLYWFTHSKDKSRNQSQQLPQNLQSLSTNYPIIVSCHDIDSMQAANHLAAMRIQQGLPPVIGMFLSPVLATQTHPDSTPLGWAQWSQLAELADMPVIGLGGLAPSLLQEAKAHGATAIAGIRQFLSGEDIG